MQIRGIHTQVAHELRKTDSAARRVESGGAARVPSRSGDTAGISAAGLNALSSSDAGVVSSILEASPEMRADRIAQVKKRIAEGYYNTPAFAEALADKLAQEFGAKAS